MKTQPPIASANDNGKATEVAFDHRLIQEAYQLTSPGLSQHSLEKSFIPVAGPDGQTQLLVKKQHATAKYSQVSAISRDKKASTGWAWHTNPSPRNENTWMQNLQAFYLDGELYVFGYHRAVPILMAWKLDKEGNWVNVIQEFRKLIGNTVVKEFRVGYDQNGNPFLYGLFSNNSNGPWRLTLVYRNKASTAWRSTRLNGNSNPQARHLQALNLEIGETGGKFLLLEQINDKIIEYEVEFKHGAFMQTVSAFGRKARNGRLHYAAIRESRDRLDFLMHRENLPELWYFHTPNPQDKYGYEILTARPEGPKAVKHVAAVELNGKCLVLALDAQFSLWRIEEKTRVDGKITFGKWVPMNEHFRYIAAAEKQTGELEFFGVSLDGKFNVQHMYQSQDSTWYVENIDNPAPPKSRTSDEAAYVTEITCSDKNGLPAQQRMVEIAATRYTEIIVNGTSFHVDARTKAKILTDGEGKVRFAVKADTLMAPTFKVHIPDMMGNKAVSVRPDVHTFEKLSKALGDDLKKAGLIDQQHANRAGDIAKALNQASNMVLKERDKKVGDAKAEAEMYASLPDWKKKTPYLHGLEIFDHADHHDFQVKPDFKHANESWELDFSAKTGATFRYLSEEEAAVYDVMAKEQEKKSLWENVGDFFQWVKNKARDIVKFV
ncbi:MAG: hypothetical protein AAF570_08160, partial [Bacteroidota bacterium]